MPGEGGALAPTEVPRDSEKADPTESLRLAEYKALRDESLRCAQLLSNAVWTAVTGFGLTAGIGAAFIGRTSADDAVLIVPGITILLCIQSAAISTIYLSELWKYIRVGYYLRTRIESHFSRAGRDSIPPMYWEHWIENQRARWLYYASLSFLQLPVGLSALAGGAVVYSKWFGVGFGHGLAGFANRVFTDTLVGFTIGLLILVDAALLLYWRGKLQAAERGEFGGEPPTTSKRSAGTPLQNSVAAPGK